MSCKVAKKLKDFPVGAFNEAIGTRVVECNKGLLNVKLSADIPKDLILKFCPIITEENTRSHVGAEEMRNNGMSHCSSKFIR